MGTAPRPLLLAPRRRRSAHDGSHAATPCPVLPLRLPLPVALVRTCARTRRTHSSQPCGAWHSLRRPLPGEAVADASDSGAYTSPPPPRLWAKLSVRSGECTAFACCAAVHILAQQTCSRRALRVTCIHKHLPAHLLPSFWSSVGDDTALLPRQDRSLTRFRRRKRRDDQSLLEESSCGAEGSNLTGEGPGPHSSHGLSYSFIRGPDSHVPVLAYRVSPSGNPVLAVNRDHRRTHRGSNPGPSNTMHATGPRFTSAGLPQARQDVTLEKKRLP